jgi:hypothetical protein
LSGTLLYLAIVAIWVCVLVPRWVRRTHSSADSRDSASVTGPGEVAADLDDGEASIWIEAEATVASVTVAGDSVTVTGDSASLAAALGTPGYLPSPAPPVPDHADPPFSATYAPPDPPGAPPKGLSPQPGEGPPQPDAARLGPAAVRPPLSRPRILQARRRLLTMLLALAIVAAACTAVGLTKWWICIPPTGMLGMYLLLLREVAHADAENDRRQREAIMAQAARQRAHDAWAAQQDWSARMPEPEAEIIDISARVRDQLYDQYADATVRAVGD